jgi:hypothetical protein
MNGASMTRNLVRSLVLLVAAGTLALVVGGCGGSDSEEGVPSELAGTYVTTLAASDLPANAPPELEAGRWELAIGALEGADKGSFLAINHPTEGTLEEPELTVDGDVLQLNDEECAQETGYVFYDNEYSWSLEGSTLTLATVKNDCPDRVAETILTSNAWTKKP